MKNNQASCSPPPWGGRGGIIFLDRDGTLIKEPPVTYQVNLVEEIEFLPNCLYALRRIVKELDYKLVLVTNQDGLGTPSNPLENFEKIQQFILKTLQNEGITFHAIHIDHTFEYENAPTRKPNTGMLNEYFSAPYDVANSVVIGDRLTDIELAQNLGCQGIWMNNGDPTCQKTVQKSLTELRSSIALETMDWENIYHFLKMGARTANIHRKTNETDIQIELNLDGDGKGEIQTGLHFFNHMLDQLARHGGIDLRLTTKGDLEIDEHHTIEDTALALGEAFAQALKNKIGMERYGFCLPMDDCLAQVAIDFGGRPWLVWDAPFHREKIGDVPTEMFFHFFKSFSDTAKCNLNIKAEGQNEHHKIEAIFKAFAKAIKMALRRDPDKMVLPTTKGIL
jgi:imidazoleglycerol-phosphate dehydratase / histidinol-phosphatase